MQGMLKTTQNLRSNEPGADAQAQDPHENAAYQAAIEFAMQALYGAEAAKQVAQAIRSASDVVDGLSSTAYEMMTVIDERTNGQVPDELLVSLASEILGEVSEIAQAAGVDIKPDMVAAAMRDMILRFVAEQGGDIRQLKQAMSRVDPTQLSAALEKAGK
jgi:hypothetical protein